MKLDLSLFFANFCQDTGDTGGQSIFMRCILSHHLFCLRGTWGTIAQARVICPPCPPIVPSLGDRKPQCLFRCPTCPTCPT